MLYALVACRINGLVLYSHLALRFSLLRELLSIFCTVYDVDADGMFEVESAEKIGKYIQANSMTAVSHTIILSIPVSGWTHI